MRIAFAAHPALGHVLPLLPLALVARDAGHDVLVLAGASVRDAVTGAGLKFAEAGPADLPAAFAQVPERAGLSGRRLAMVTWSRAFGGVIAPLMADAVLALAGDGWRPDLVVHDDSEQGTWIAAERLGVPHVSLQATAWRGTGVRLSAAPLGQLRETLGLSPDPDLARWHRHGYLVTRPRSLWNPDDPPPATAAPLRPVAMDEAGGEVPAWIDEPPANGRPRVAVTLGTIVPGRLEGIGAAVRGLADLDVDIIATVGHNLDPAAVEVPRQGVHILRYVPMSRLLASSDALVFHAGSGTMLAALAARLPMVALPYAADQPENADRLEAAGAGIQIPASARTPTAIRDAVERVLTEPAHRRAARMIAAEIEAMPAPSDVLPRLEALAREGPAGVLRSA